jgi:hypothetical protein
MADMEQDVFDAGASEAPPPDVAPSSPQPSVSPPSQDSRAISDAIDAIRGPVPNYGTQPQAAPQPPPAPPNPDDEPVKAGILRDLLNERAARQRYEAQVRDFQTREQERQRQQAQPKTEDLLFQDPEGFKRSLQEETRKEIANLRLESDMQLAAMRHGPMFDHAWQHFFQSCQNGADPVSYFRVMNARSPGEEMVRWFNERRIMHETGGDINVYRHRVAAQLLQDPEFLAYMQQQQSGAMPPPNAQRAGQMQPRGDDGRFQPQQQPRHEVRLPSSLSKMNGASRGVSFDEPEDGSDEAIFDAGRPRSKQ